MVIALVILVGYEIGSGKPVNMDITHTVIAGITRSGKSETVKALVERAKNHRFLIFDSKSPRDYNDLGIDIPIYIKEKTDPLTLKRLLESQSHLTLKFEFPELLKVCKKAETYQEILNTVNESLRSKIHPIRKDKLLVLQHLLGKLVKELEKTPISDTLKLNNRVNVMNLSDTSLELQQLAVHSTMQYLLQNEENLIVIMDEASRFIPQMGSNASKETVIRCVREGGAKNLWLWVIDQTVTGVSKNCLKQAWLWILGKQREINEAKRTLQQIPFKIGLDEKAIMRLKVGEFIVCSEDGAKLTYVQPRWLSPEVARNVALGSVSPKDVKDAYEKSREEKRGGEFKERYLKLKRNLDEMSEKLNELSNIITKLKEENRKLKKENEQLRKELENRTAEIEKLSIDIAIFRKLKEALSEIITTPKTSAQPEYSPSKISVTTEMPTIQINVKHEPLKLTDKDLHGKIAIIYSEGALGNGWFSVSDVVRAFNRHAWDRDPKISKALNDFTRWGYLEKKYAGRKPIYRVLIKPKEAKNKGLLIVTEENP